MYRIGQMNCLTNLIVLGKFCIFSFVYHNTYYIIHTTTRNVYSVRCFVSMYKTLECKRKHLLYRLCSRIRLLYPAILFPSQSNFYRIFRKFRLLAIEMAHIRQLSDVSLEMVDTLSLSIYLSRVLNDYKSTIYMTFVRIGQKIILINWKGRVRSSADDVASAAVDESGRQR